MKLALVFLLAFVATSYQQRFQYRMPWKSNNYDVDDSYYQPRRFPDAYYNDYYSNPLARQQPFVDEDIDMIHPSSVENDEDEDRSYPISNRFWDSMMYRSSPSPSNWFFDQYINSYYKRKNNNNNLYFRNRPTEEDDQQQIQPRGRYRPAAAAVASPENRFFGYFQNNNDVLFSATSAANNYGIFGKTRGVISTSTVNLTSVVSCVVSTEFVAGRNAPACRRRRRGMEHLLAFDDLVGSPSVSPTAVEKLETTLAPDSQTSYEQRNAKLNELLASSKDELIIEDEDDESNRDKRSWFNYVTTTTLTSYTFFSTSVTKTVRLLTAATTSALTCLPASFTFC